VGISNFVLSVNLAFFLLILYSFRFKPKQKRMPNN
jgi:hypothetical protein